MTRTYIITFHIENQYVRDQLKDHIRKTRSSYCPINENAWAIRDSKKAAEIRNELIPFLAVNDQIFVIRSGTEAAWSRSYSEKNDNWLKEFL